MKTLCKINNSISCLSVLVVNGSDDSYDVIGRLASEDPYSSPQSEEKIITSRPPRTNEIRIFAAIMDSHSKTYADYINVQQCPNWVGRGDTVLALANVVL